MSLRGEWIANGLGLKRKRMPSHHTYRRILAEILEAQQLEEVARKHHRHSGEAGYRVVISMDGKILRGTIDMETSEGLCLLAVFLPGEGITLAVLSTCLTRPFFGTLDMNSAGPRQSFHPQRCL